jgi:hypothetical protein
MTSKEPGYHLVARMYVTSDKMLHGFGSFPGSPWSLSTSKPTGLEPMPLFNQTSESKGRDFYRKVSPPMLNSSPDSRIAQSEALRLDFQRGR